MKSLFLKTKKQADKQNQDVPVLPIWRLGDSQDEHCGRGGRGGTPKKVQESHPAKKGRLEVMEATMLESTIQKGKRKEKRHLLTY